MGLDPIGINFSCIQILDTYEIITKFVHNYLRVKSIIISKNLWFLFEILKNINLFNFFFSKSYL